MWLVKYYDLVFEMLFQVSLVFFVFIIFHNTLKAFLYKMKEIVMSHEMTPLKKLMKEPCVYVSSFHSKAND